MNLNKFLDTFPYGVLVCDHQRKVVTANQCASIILGVCGQGFQVGHVIPHADNLNGHGLHNAVSGAIKGASQMVVLRDATGKHLMVSVSPLLFDDGNRGALVTTEPSPLCMRETVSVFADLHRLSVAETRTLLVLSQGCSPQEVASELTLAIATVRSHISAILTKTESACLRSLVAKVSKLPRIVGFAQG